MLLIPLPLGSDFSQPSGGNRDFPKEPALAVITGSCINKVEVLKNKNFMPQRCLLAQEFWQAGSSAAALASSYFDHVPWLPLHCQTEKASFSFIFLSLPLMVLIALLCSSWAVFCPS